MKLYLLTQSKNHGYDTYDSCVVAATSPSTARKIHPGECNVPGAYKEWWKEERHWGSWAETLEQVEVEFIGNAKRGTKAGIICSSFNAG